ncbi:heme o synthase [Bacillus sp. Marseille-P3661]|uniref:heme o synthase n=1 Tax=Bacillus sp. Marseille-P3661 TaxID=1936234 RepID=UPI0021552593|nr:heme o synthase [Bacillus sp. Marseille-P3661]
MSNNITLTQQKMEKANVWNKSISSIITDLKYLFKAGVLISNVLPVFTGLWLALYFTNTSFATKWDIVLLTIIGSTMVMAGALVINNWYDVDIDSIMDRTKKRPTVTGNIPLKVVLMLGVSLSVLGMILLLFTTIETVAYAFVGWFTYVILYTMWSKRRYTANTLIGSVSGAVTPMIGWAAIDSALHIVPITLFVILFIWQMPHTYAIAMKKCDEYKAAGVAMLPVVRGFKVTKRHMVVYICLLLPLPLFLISLGTVFVVIATLMNVGWLILSFNGFFTKDNYSWAHMNFMYSVNYIMIIFFIMILVTLF